MAEEHKWISFEVCVCLSELAAALMLRFVFQSPDKKRVLTSQRTFDSEGEKPPSVLPRLLFFFPQ